MGEAKNGEIRQITNETIWEDRKHHLWFPLSFTKYSVANGRLYVNSGMLSSREDECLLYRITDISMTRSLAQRLFGTGTIHLNTKDRSTPVIRLENIANPAGVKRVLSDLIEKEREEKHVVGRDMYGASSHLDPEEFD
ncbi:MAG: PH domain-containing protein [Eubacterium sp.]|nr:PH domain-containing protein [Eubacterium sp.]MDD7209885.1 PH domain-containing protein [Lachnospiraceae bacterium]MDY5496963.1 PH domain-containing protein [Anaerobutyricum sp.]